MGKPKYINFPIQLINGFLVDSNKCLNNIMEYGCYAKSLKLEHGSHLKRFKRASDYFGIEFSTLEKSFESGEELFNSLPLNAPKTGISMLMLLDFHKNYKDEFEKVCLLGFLAIKSIVQNKAYCKITNLYWISRMDGQSKVNNKNLGLSEAILKYNNEYQLGKIKKELILNWKLIHYSRYTRGFYVSFELTQKELIKQAEIKRKSNQIKRLQIEQQKAFNEAMQELKG